MSFDEILDRTVPLINIPGHGRIPRCAMAFVKEVNKLATTPAIGDRERASSKGA